MGRTTFLKLTGQLQRVEGTLCLREVVDGEVGGEGSVRRPRLGDPRDREKDLSWTSESLLAPPPPPSAKSVNKEDFTPQEGDAAAVQTLK